MSALAGCGLLLLIAVVAVVVTVAAVLAIRKDSKHGTSGALSSAMTEIESLLEPSKRHTTEAVRRESEEEDESGDPPQR